MQLLLISIIIIYIALLIAIGLYSKSKITSTQDFFLANRHLHTFALMATITATTVGGSATIVAGGRIYAQGLPALWYEIAGVLGLIVLGLFLAKKVRKTRRYTLPDIIAELYNENVRYASALLIFITEIAWVSLLIQSSGLILSVLLPFQYEIILVLITMVFITYTLIGGRFAVVYTDIIQFVVMIVGICFVASPLLLHKALPSIHQIPAVSLSFPLNENIGILTAGSIFFMMFLPHIVGPDIYSKLLCARDEQTARTGAILAGVCKFIFAISIAIIAISAIILYPTIQNPYMAIPTALSQLNPFLSGVVLAAFVSVMLSSADSCLLSAGTILSVDIIKKKNIGISQIGILIVGMSSLILALFITNIETLIGTHGVLNTLQLAYTIFTAGLTMPVLFGFYKQKTKTTSKGALWSLTLGGSSSVLWLYFAPNGEYAVLVGLLLSIIPLIILRQKNQKDNNNV
ncbi:MAG: sodium:solute symporter family protein [Thermoplasmatota archaeon]